MVAKNFVSFLSLAASFLLCAAFKCFVHSHHARSSNRRDLSLPETTRVRPDSVPLNDGLSDDEKNETYDEWKDYQNGFDWELEKVRRILVEPGFSPLPMLYWKPPPETSDEINSVSTFDTAYILFRNVLQRMGWESVDGAPLAEVGNFKGNWVTFIQKVSSGKLEELAGGPLFLMLQKYFQKYGPVYKLAFGPRSFIVISDPVMAKHILKSNIGSYDKGILATILEPIMGKGLIPADTETWKLRRRAIVPGFHKKWLNRMMKLFAECNLPLLESIGCAAGNGSVLDMEEKFCSVSLDIIGKAVFNYEFGSTTKESPIIKAVYRVLREAEHRSSSFIPYWEIPFSEVILPSQREFKSDMKLLNDILDDLIAKATTTQTIQDVKDLEERDLESAEDPSLLRFLIDMRGEDTSSKQLRDDLMTMLIAGHETTAAVLTWTLFNLVQNEELYRRVQAEIDSVLGPSRLPEYDDLVSLRLTRMALIEALRLYPEPPLLIRKALKEDYLPKGGAEKGVYLLKGSDVFISTWNLHRSPTLWDEPEKYDPDRFLRSFSNPLVEGWNGYDCKVGSAGLYPSEVAADFAFLPFGGGQRKCVGDQFAIMEAVVTMSMVLRSFDLSLVGAPEDTGMVTGATIHTANGLMMRATKRGQE